MSVDLTRVREALNKAPLKLLLPFFFLAFYSSILLYVVLSPFIYIYGLLLCSKVWIEWSRQGKDLLVVHTDGKYSDEWMSRLSPLIANRAVLLNYGERDRWLRWSLPVQLFEIFGPKSIPEFFRKHSLPAVIVFRRLRLPQTWTFGERSQEREEKLEQLRAQLSLD